jgi:uncharacterized protein YndB with AHSA1/START domain
MTNTATTNTAETNTAETNTAETTIAITRTFDAPRQLVWNAWTDPDQFGQWFGPGKANTTMDLRPGGDWRCVMLDDGGEKPFWGQFQEIDEPDRLVLTFTDTPDGLATITVELTETDDGRTHMAFTQTGPLPDEAVPAATQGWNGFFDQLATLVTTT